MISDTAGNYVVFHQYGLSCAILDRHYQQMISDTVGTCVVFHQYGFLYAVLDDSQKQMISDIEDKYMVFSSMVSHVSFYTNESFLT